MLRRSLFVLGFAALVATSAIAQLTVGRLYSTGGTGYSTALVPNSAIDIMHPAAGAGNLTHAVVRWAGRPGTPCPNAFVLKFLHPADVFGAFETFAERGPFPGGNGTIEITLSPLVGMGPGDLIAISQLVSPDLCGGFVQQTTPEGVTVVADSPLLTTLRRTVQGITPAIFASSGEASVVSILAAAGTVPGSNGSFFRTAVQITNTDSVPLAGRLIYHPQGVIGKTSDPSMPFNVVAHQTLSIPDIATALGQTGLGSIDVLTSGMPPIVSARIFNDGPSGTSGFTEEGLSPYEALALGQNGYLQIPADVTNFRMNVGIRTLTESVVIFVTCTAADGSAVGQTVTKSYLPSFYEQTSAQSFAGLSALPPGGTIKIQLIGKAIIYGTTTDNRTNDSSMQFALASR